MLLDQERQHSGTVGEGRRQHVVGVEVPQVGEDVDELVVELPLGQGRQPLEPEAETLQGIGGVHRPLQRQVHVQAVDHRHRLANDRGSLCLGQRDRLVRAQLGERDGGGGFGAGAGATARWACG